VSESVLAEPSPVLVATELRKRYGTRLAVDGVSFRVSAGEAYGLLGPNGAGKTTTISMICGIIERDGGDVTVGGHRVTGDASAAKAVVGYVPQDLAVYAELTARENVLFFGAMYGLSGARLRDRANDVLRFVGLEGRAHDLVSTFSGGMRRRLNLAAGLLHEPALLVLDEPTVGVDPQTRNLIFEGVERLRSSGVAIVYTTHYMEEAERLCDRVGIIDEGRIVAEGTRRELVGSLGGTDRVQIIATGDLVALSEALGAVEGVVSVAATDGGVTLACRDGRSRLPRLVIAAERSGASIAGVEVVEPDLETVFLQLTGKALRE
jgi:ABC-2 type transport system ATP-binding protein